jgi:hypothetical protein
MIFIVQLNCLLYSKKLFFTKSILLVFFQQVSVSNASTGSSSLVVRPGNKDTLTPGGLDQ